MGSQILVRSSQEDVGLCLYSDAHRFTHASIGQLITIARPQVGPRYVVSRFEPKVLSPRLRESSHLIYIWTGFSADSSASSIDRFNMDFTLGMAYQWGDSLPNGSLLPFGMYSRHRYPRT